MAYLLDANVFIQAKNLHYGFDFCPAFWDWIDRQHTAGTVFSIEKVEDELRAIADELSTWAAHSSSCRASEPGSSCRLRKRLVSHNKKKDFVASTPSCPMPRPGVVSAS